MQAYAFWLRDILLVLLVLASSYTDLRYHRIRNVHTFPAMLVGLLLGAVSGGWRGFGAAAAGIGIGLLGMGILFITNVMKAGDVKLAMAIGALIGPLAAFRSIVLSFVLYLPVGLAYLVGSGHLRNMGTAIKRMGRHLYTVFHPALSAEPLELEGMTLAPFGMVLGVAALLVHFQGWLGLDGFIP